MRSCVVKKLFVVAKIAAALVFSIALLLVYAGNAQALMRKMSPEELNRGAGTIVVGTVEDVSSSWNDDRTAIYTKAVIAVDESLKGPVGDRVTVVVPGGMVGEITQWVEDTPVFSEGEKIKLFLKEVDAAGMRAIGLKETGEVLSADVMAVHGQCQGKIKLDGEQSGLSLRILSRNGALETALDEAPVITGITYDQTLNGISPYAASAGTNTQVTVTGSGFGSRGLYDELFFFYEDDWDGYWCMTSDIDSWSNTQIKARVPFGIIDLYPYAAASGPVHVVKNTWQYNEIWSNGIPRVTTFGYGQNKWHGSSPTVSYKVNTGGDQDRLDAIQAAANTWNSGGAKFKLNYAGATSASQISLNGTNEIFWEGLPEGLLGQACVWFDDSGWIQEADFSFNNNYSWSAGSTCPQSRMDVQTIATHELGHWLFLTDLYGDLEDYPKDVDKIMYGYCSYGETKRSLHPHDRLGIQWIYGNSGSPLVYGIGLYNQQGGSYLIKDTPYAGVADRTFRYGPLNNNWFPATGDWTGDGVHGLALYDQAKGSFLIKDTPYAGVADRTFRYGPLNNKWIPVAGDWTGDGVFGVALYDQKTGTFYIKDTPYAGVADRTFRYGPVNNYMIPVAGDWTGDGVFGVALYDQKTGTFYIKDTPYAGVADRTFRYGSANNNMIPVAGDWAGCGMHGVALYDQKTGTFLIKDTPYAGVADRTFRYGPVNNRWRPVSGRWK